MQNGHLIEMIEHLTQRVDVCEVEYKKSRDQARKYKQQLQIKTNEIKETKELLNQIFDKLNESDKKLDQAMIDLNRSIKEQEEIQKRLYHLEAPGKASVALEVKFIRELRCNCFESWAMVSLAHYR